MDVFQVDRGIVKTLYPKRPAWCRKGDFGKVLVVGGSEKYTGAPALCGMAALRAGCDLVSIMAPERAADADASLSPNLITIPFHELFFREKDVPEVMKQVEKADAVLIGPGIGTEPETMKFVQSLVKLVKKPCVLDADALKAVKGKKLGKNFIITPHGGEYEIICGEKPDVEPGKRLIEVQNLANKMDCTVILKGHVDVISDGVKVAVNETGNPFMTKGGTGDVLAGIVLALLGRKADSFDAACGGALISGAAGDAAAQHGGESLLATDIIDAIPSIINLKK
jgi:ADP-dependent NAD(P)H-hydrate dehydratase / NAD(P)H-hydrate epimerase